MFKQFTVKNLSDSKIPCYFVSASKILFHSISAKPVKLQIHNTKPYGKNCHSMFSLVIFVQLFPK